MMDVKMRQREKHPGKRQADKTERWKDRLDTENVIDGKRGGNIEWWRPSSITACLCFFWGGGAVVKGTVARGWEGSKAV